MISLPACPPEKPMRLNFRRGKFQFLANVRRISFCFVFVFDFPYFSSSSSSSFSALLAAFGGDGDSHVLSQRELSAGLQPLCFWGSSCAGLNSFRESRNAAAKMGKKDEQGQAGMDRGLAGQHQICRKANVLTKNAVKFASSFSVSSTSSVSLCLSGFLNFLCLCFICFYSFPALFVATRA